ncbi:MAG: DUF2007 domain-containing protein [Firmicutes bacterium]|nr:DUF2007 domain-containing protein [Bacillota bacterium]
MYYCNKCKRLSESAVCGWCGTKKHIRQPEPADMVFLTENDSVWSEMLEEALRENGIPCICRQTGGAGLGVFLGSAAGYSRLYVAYSDYEAARELLKNFEATDDDADCAE